MTRFRRLLPVALALAALVCGGVLIVRASALRVRDAEQTIRTALDNQGSALLRGDRSGWLREVDASLWPEMIRLYANLRGFELSSWIPRTTSVSGTGSVWHASVQARVCFAGAHCRRDPDSYVPLGDVLTASTTWRITAGHATLTAFAQQSTPAMPAAVPWKSAALTFATGARVIVAASDDSVRPSTWLAAADRAAQAADRYALSSPRPGKYLIYLAASGEWETAIGDDREAEAFVDRTSKETAFTVVDAAEPSDERLLRHELGHVATLLGTLGGHADWAIEGMAEYIAWEQTPMTAYRLTSAARNHITRTGWKGRLDLDWSTDPTDRVGFYAMAYLAFRCLGATYGDRKLLSFFATVVREGRTPAEAAPPTLGAPWPEIQSTCAPKIRSWLALH
ncbi:hypothetical protein [Winogradskya humida]|uniref:Peptidase MA-like domain-containing protein n=1 Tax=Winogradskya humida TaxID=113566 RepID=A0ABQ4A303_9ACTN|nr:hypothetical protein [Actinoplanes humidus]GIE25236.1 hypothetical protein Ahu01nite_083380 [Actinoplanes humidus]